MILKGFTIKKKIHYLTISAQFYVKNTLMTENAFICEIKKKNSKIFWQNVNFHLVGRKNHPVGSRQKLSVCGTAYLMQSFKMAITFKPI